MENYLGASVVAQVKDDSNMTHGRSWEFRGIRNSMKDLFTWQTQPAKHIDEYMPSAPEVLADVGCTPGHPLTHACAHQSHCTSTKDHLCLVPNLFMPGLVVNYLMKHWPKKSV